MENEEKRCTCQGWARSARNGFNLEAAVSCAVTFTCPKHGTVTIDMREFPRPPVIFREREPRYPMRPYRPRLVVG